MQTRLTALVAIVALVLSVVALCQGPRFEVEAAGLESRDVSFFVPQVTDEANGTVVGTVPPGRTLVLRDFLFPSFGFSLDILADGEIVATIPFHKDAGSSFTNMFIDTVHLSGGIVIEGGKEVAVRAGRSQPSLTVTGVLK